MTIKVHEFDGGFISYRLPRIGQAMSLLGYMGISTQEDKAKKLAEQSELVAIGKLVDLVPEYIVDLRIPSSDGDDITDANEASESPEAAGPMSEVAIEIFQYCMRLQGGGKKKPQAQPKNAKKRAQGKSAKSRPTTQKQAARSKAPG